MKVLAHDPFVSASLAREQGIQLAELDQVFAAADYLTLHVGLTPQTSGMINEKSLAQMKKGVRIINCARGELLDEAARCRGAGQQTSWRHRRWTFSGKSRQRIRRCWRWKM